MRKKYLFLVLTIVLALLLVVAGCTPTGTQQGNGKKVSSVTAVSTHEGDYIIGEAVDLSEISIVIRYTDGTERSVVADDYMLDGENREKFTEAGTHTVTFVYEELTAYLQITVVEREEGQVYLAQFFSNGGSMIPNQTTDVINYFANPTLENYKFMGWYTSPDFSGSKAVAPFTLMGDTTFYAKWEDNRRCNVKFYDGADLMYDFDVVYGTGINIRDLEEYPAPGEKEGKIFTGWTLSTGSSLEEIIADTVIVAAYESVKCVVSIEYDDGEKIVTNPYTLNYGDTFDVGRYTMPKKEGHTSRWVLYRGDNAQYEELDENDLVITVTDTKISIKPEHVINKYTVTIYNGKSGEEQTHDDLKAGNIATEQVYFNEDTKSNFTVEYGSDFNLSEFTQEPYLIAPMNIYGYTTQWCYVIDTPTGEVWYNKNNEIWNENIGEFVADGEATTNFVLYDKDGNYVAKLKDGDLKEVKGDVLIRPKYEKISYTVRLLRLEEKGWNLIDSFTKEYLSDFSLYDPTEHPEGKFSTDKEVEFYYHKNNVPEWAGEVESSWEQIYFNGNSEDDFEVKWYTSSDRNEGSAMNFRQEDGSLGSYEVSGDISFFCEDIDLRKYTVTISYDYDFETGMYKERTSYEYITENATITLPEGYSASVTRDYGLGRTVQYVFDGWYDYPYIPDGNYVGRRDEDFITHRTNNVYYYAHYRCDTTYTLTVFDKTQKDAYEGIVDFEENYGKNYDVPENTIVYTVPAGTNVTTEWLMKGRVNDDGTFTSGQNYYEKQLFINYFDNEYTALYDSYVAEYDPATLSVTVAIDAISAEISEKQNRADAYVELLSKIYSYDYEGVDKDYFEATFMTVAEYQALVQEIADLSDKLAVMTDYSENKVIRDGYDQEDIDDKDAGLGGIFKLYSDSEYYLNLAYGYDIKENSDEYKYKFAGWYIDDTYSEMYAKDMNFEWFAWDGDITLYAKWADEEKGTEGLVFRQVYDESNNVIGMVVVDFMNRADYEASDFYGCGFNNFVDGNDYSINLNDQGAMPANLGQDIDVQIPTSHGGTNSDPLPVIGILAGAFRRHGQDVRSIAIPNTIQFVEDNAFTGCNLNTISNNGATSLVVEDEAALYQVDEYSYYVGGELRQSYANTLIIFANKSAKDSYTLRTDTLRIADNAFNLTTNLKTVTLNDGLTYVGKQAFSGSGITGTVNIPSTVTTVDDSAFKNCTLVDNVILQGASTLSTVGKYAFKDTGWFMSQVGLVSINGIVIGLRGGKADTFDKGADNTAQIVEIEGIEYYVNENGAGRILYNMAGEMSIIEISADMKEIAPNAFEGSIVGADVTVNILGSLVDGIGEEAFVNCGNVTALNIADGSTCIIKNNSFNGCNIKVMKKASEMHASWTTTNNNLEFLPE